MNNMADIFNKQLPKKCAYCEFSGQELFNGEILCKKHGVVKTGDFCRRYKYDPFKRVPKSVRPSDNYNPEDFSL